MLFRIRDQGNDYLYDPIINTELSIHCIYIFPSILIAYIDQTDMGDEICRYKNNKVYENGILKLVQPEAHLMYRDLFNYSQIYGISKIYLNNKPKVLKTFQLIEFKNQGLYLILKN